MYNTKYNTRLHRLRLLRNCSMLGITAAFRKTLRKRLAYYTWVKDFMVYLINNLWQMRLFPSLFSVCIIIHCYIVCFPWRPNYSTIRPNKAMALVICAMYWIWLKTWIQIFICHFGSTEVFDHFGYKSKLSCPPTIYLSLMCSNYFCVLFCRSTSHEKLVMFYLL